MNDLNEILNLNLKEISIYEIDEEKLIALKSCDYYIKNNFYFWLINRIYTLENKGLYKELAYAHYLMSYYVFIVLTPLAYEELSFYHVKKALDYDNNIQYKEWLLIFSTLPVPLLNTYDALKIAEEVLKHKENSTLATTILEIF
ncbi:MAG: hypothetical protein E7212_00370 [Clostridium sartagoforme]|nr:hypothetical protein [Clostridium sartagoforme]